MQMILKQYMVNRFLGLIACLFMLDFTFSQELQAKDQRSFDFEHWRVLFQMNGPNNWNAALNFAKPVHDKWALRFGITPIVVFNRSRGENPNVAEYEFYNRSSKNKKLGANLSFGAEFHFLAKAKLDPYCLFGTGIGGLIELNKRDESYKLITPRSDGLSEYERVEQSTSAPQFSLNPFAGFGLNYFFHERLAFGIEYSLSPNMNLVKGSTTSTIEGKEVFISGQVDDLSDKIESEVNSFFININQQIGFHFLYALKGQK